MVTGNLIGECFDVSSGSEGHNPKPFRPKRFDYSKRVAANRTGRAEDGNSARRHRIRKLISGGISRRGAIRLHQIHRLTVTRIRSAGHPPGTIITVLEVDTRV